MSGNAILNLYEVLGLGERALFSEFAKHTYGEESVDAFIELPTSIIDGLYPEGIELGGPTWEKVQALNGAIQMSSSPEMIELMSAFVDFWRPYAPYLNSKKSFPSKIDGSENPEPEGAKLKPWSSLAPIPNRYPAYLTSVYVKEVFYFEDWDAWHPLLDNYSDSAGALAELVIRRGYLLSLLWLLTPWEVEEGLRTWEQHETALAPLKRIAELAAETHPEVMELPFTKEIFDRTKSLLSSSPEKVN